MSTRKNEISKKFKQNKINRVNKKNKEYNKKETSKSDINYINGSYKKSVNQTAYGVKKALAKGEKVHGYGSDYIDTKGMKRSRYVKKQNGENPYDVKYLHVGGTPKYVQGGKRDDGSTYDSFYTQKRKLTRHERESFNNTGTLNHKEYMPKEKYKIFDSANKKANKFKDHLNTTKLDGLKTAAKNQRNGRHLSNAFELLKGAGKDFLLDPAIDALKVADSLGSTTVAGISGFAEDSGNVVKAFADPKRDLKYYTKGKSHTVNNLKENFDKLNKTGSGQSLSKYLHDARKRGFEENYNIMKEKGRHDDAKEYKKRYKKETPLATNLLNVTGFVGELAAPSTLENIVFGGGKAIVKNSAKSFKDMVKGTADLSTAIVPEETARLMAKAQKYTNKLSKNNKASDDVFFSGKKGTTSIDKKLDNQYKKALDNVKDKVNNNPNTKNIGKFLDVLENSKSYKGKQSKIDGRTLNKKYTQTKDGYVPNKIDNVNEVENTLNQNVSGQYSMFGKDGSVDSYVKNIENPNANYEKVFNKYSNNVDELVDKIESMKPHNRDAMYNYLRTNKPDVYNKIVSDSDVIDDVIYSSANRKTITPKKQQELDNRYFKTPNVREFSNINKVDNVSELNKNYNDFNLNRTIQKDRMAKNYEILKEVINPKLADDFSSLPARKSAYKQGITAYLDNIKKLDYNGLKQSLNALEDISNMPKGTPTYKKAQHLNKILFNNKQIIKTNIPENTLNNFMDFLEDNINLNISNKLGDKSFTRKNGEIFNIHNAIGELNDLSGNANMFAPALTDVLYEEKLKDIATKLQVPKKKILENRKNELEALRKERVLKRDEYYELQDVKEKISMWDNMYKEVRDMGDEYIEYAQKKFGKVDKNKGYKEALEETSIEQKERDIIKEINVSKGANDLNSKRNRETGSVRHQQSQLEGVGEYAANKYTTQELNKMKYESKILNEKADNIRKTYNLPKPNTKLKVKLTKGQKFKDLPPVKDNLAHLKKTIQKEVKYMFENPDKYDEFKDAFKQVKLDYVNTLRSIGVPDEKYFDKVVSLQNELKTKMNELRNGGTKSSPLLKMELQKLARKIDDTFKGFDDISLDKFDDVVDDPFGDFDIEDAIKNVDNSKQSENLTEFFESLKSKREDITYNPSKAPMKESNAIPSPSDLINKGMSKEDAFEAVSKMLNGEIEVPKVNYKKKVGKDGYTRYERDGVEDFNLPKKQIKQGKSNDKLPLYKDNEIYDGYKRWLNSYKKGLTVYNPGWHVQNFLQNKGQNFLAFGMDAFKPQTDAKNVLKKINGEDFTDTLILNKKSNKAYTTDEIAKLANDLGVVDGLGEDVKNARGIFSRLENRVDNTPLMKWASKNEQTARLNHFIKQIERGLSPEDAAKSVNKYLFDYSKKGKVDEFMGDFVDPFWTFHKNNARLMYTSAFEHGDKIAKINRATKGLEQGLPKEQEQLEKNKYGKIQLPYVSTKDGVNKDDYNLLYSETVMPNFKNAFPLDDEDIENKLNPIVRAFFQDLRGEGNFNNKVIKEGKPEFDEITKEDRLLEVVEDINPFMPILAKTANKSIGRFKKAEKEKQSYKTSEQQALLDWINYIAGSKVNLYRNSDI
jgi:hypothetical protein